MLHQDSVLADMRIAKQNPKQEYIWDGGCFIITFQNQALLDSKK